MKNFFKKQNVNKRGFSLVETLVALFIFSIAITATMAVISQGITNINSAKKKVTASFLAQEGIEQVRNMRDTEVFFAPDKQTGWNSFMSKFQNCMDGDICYIDDENFYNNTEMIVNQCSGGQCLELKYYKNSGKYGYSSGDNSGFTRHISILAMFSSSLESPSEDPIVFSEVLWKENGITKRVNFKDYLTNWAE